MIRHTTKSVQAGTTTTTTTATTNRLAPVSVVLRAQNKEPTQGPTAWMWMCRLYSGRFMASLAAHQHQQKPVQARHGRFSATP